MGARDAGAYLERTGFPLRPEPTPAALAELQVPDLLAELLGIEPEAATRP